MRANRMGRIAAAGVLALGVAACGNPAAQELDVAGITEEVEGAVASLFEAMNSGDGEAVMAHYQGVGNFLYAGITRTAADFENWSAQARAWYASHPDVEFEHQLLSLQVMAPTVAVTAVQGSSTEAEFLLWTHVWVKDDATGRWLITSEHESWPDCVDPPRAHPGTTG